MSRPLPASDRSKHVSSLAPRVAGGDIAKLAELDARGEDAYAVLPIFSLGHVGFSALADEDEKSLYIRVAHTMLTVGSKGEAMDAFIS